jgi:hypothetical protein
VDEGGFKRWLDEYKHMWETGDRSALPSLYTEDAKYYETPFDEPMVGLEQIAGYGDEAAGAQREISFWYDIYGVIGDTGLARWGAAFERVPSGVKVKLDGVFAIRMDNDNRCYELREWWHRIES